MANMKVGLHRHMLVLMPLLLLAVQGCGFVANDRPPVTDSLYAEVLIDLHLAATMAKRGETPPFSADSILALHGIDSVAYQQAALYYGRHPEEAADVYGRAMDRLSTLTGRMSAPSGPPDGYMNDRGGPPSF